MPIPAVDNSHVSEATGLLTSRYADKAVVKGIVTALALRVQEVENSFWSLVNAVQLANHPMPGGPWDVLDKLGAIVGAVRNGLSDSAFLALIKLQARVNRSRGLAEDILLLASLLAAPGAPQYLDQYPAAFYIGAWNINPAYPIFPLLKQARPAGVYGFVAYSTWVDGNDFEFSSRAAPTTTGQGKWGSRTSPSTGGLLVAGVGI